MKFGQQWQCKSKTDYSTTQKININEAPSWSVMQQATMQSMPLINSAKSEVKKKKVTNLSIWPNWEFSN